ncbi:16S rRNA (guanine(966)-N(2))-methyltransferase RsmD [Halomonas sp. V046]|uniref:16S rRNA (guanine(966)-N(2))-methyltransferase RsmD n=1 Tax=Halomonas sp. V046 TaxID=3459611 RepID=UPI00404476D8
MTPRRSSSARPRRPAKGKGGALRQGKLRIIGGDHRRRLLPVLDKPGLRPTPDRVRETLFNWLTGELHGARVLDLFAGTGALGLEAMSRGALRATFVERDSDVATALTENLATLGIDEATVVTHDATAWLKGQAEAHELVFLDPPFRLGLADACCEALEAGGWLADSAWIYLETEAELTPMVPDTWQLRRDVRAGDSHGRLYRRQD